MEANNINLKQLSIQERLEAFKAFASERHGNQKGLTKLSLQKYVSGLTGEEMSECTKTETGKDNIFDIIVPNEVNSIREFFLSKNREATDKRKLDHYRDFASYVLKYKDFISYCNGEEMQIVSDEPSNEKFSISSTIKKIATTGLVYEDNLVKRFAFSLLAKPFVILSGLAGSGKTQLALTFADSLSTEPEEQVLLVPVGADWTNREPLFGFANSLMPNEYIMPDSGVLQFLLRASHDKSRPYFLILDEMNMSYVERYFADFLSAMESGKDIHLWSGENKEVPQSITLPPNLFIIGTINVDETTYMFSPKVLDRANVIEFRIVHQMMEHFLLYTSASNKIQLKASSEEIGKSFVSIAMSADINADKSISDALLSFFDVLKKANAEFGFRTAKEIYRFAYIAKQYDDTLEKMECDEILDAAIIQKLLPKLHGSFKAIRGVLVSLWNLCFIDEAPDIGTTNLDNEEVGARYMKAAEKIQRMYLSAQNNGFTSFAEA